MPQRKTIGSYTITKPTARQKRQIINKNCIILSVVKPIRGIVSNKLYKYILLEIYNTGSLCAWSSCMLRRMSVDR